MVERADTNGNDGEVDVAALQAQLQADRARLAEQIGNRLSSLSPQKGSSAARKTSNPFAMPGQSNGFGMASSSRAPFQHRPANLGLGATLATPASQQQSVQDRRLKGALLAGKRKRAEEAVEGQDDAEATLDTDSKSALLTNGKGKGRQHDQNPKSNGKPAKLDPFARKKKSKIAAADNVAKSAEETKLARSAELEKSPELSGAAPSTTADMQGLSKSAKKKLKKKLRMQEQSVNGQEAASPEEDDRAAATELSSREADAAHVNGTSNGVNGTGKKEANLTPAQRAMQSQLLGSRFRQINETLYTTTSDEAVKMVADEPSVLADYHEGFREQVKSWPQVPVRQIFDELEAAQVSSQDGKAKAQKGASLVRESLGRRQPGALVVDLGAGDGFLAKWVGGSKTLSGLTSPPRILSYDLLDSSDGWVRGIDIARSNAVPLPGTSIDVLTNAEQERDAARCADVAVFCLALMATNWLESILEASRILRPGGELLIAEVTSRLVDNKQFRAVIEACGFRCTREDSSNTHFVRFDFVKKRAQTWQPPYKTPAERKSFIESGALLLKPCIYKRR